MTDPSPARPPWTRSTVTASDGVALAVFQAGAEPAGRPDAPALLLVHGYPDDHHVWDAVALELADRFHLAAFDVRGAGASGVPARRAAYGIDQLADDIELVAGTVGRGQPVHLVGHDWGSVQSWRAVTRPGAASSFASFTSISGPDVRYAGAWLRSTARHDRRRALRQVASSCYIGMFLLPVVPELLWRTGLGHRLAGPGAPSRSVPDAVRGLELYRANLHRATLRRPRGERPRPCPLPVLVLAPRADKYVGVPMQTEAPRPWVADLTVAEIEGSHWTMTAHPARVAGPVAEFTLRRAAGERRPG